VTKFRFYKQPFKKDWGQSSDFINSHLKKDWGQNARIDFVKLFVFVFFIRNNVIIYCSLV